MVGLLLTAGLVLSFLASNVGPSEARRSDRMSPPQPQHSAERVFPSITVERLRVFGEEVLYDSDMIRLGPDGSVYVFDRGASQVVRFDPETGQVLQRYGRGPGKGPGEFAMVSDFEVDPLGRVYVSDLETGRISLFAADGSLLATLKPRRLPNNLALLNANLIVVHLINPHNDALFELYRLEQRGSKYRLRFVRRFGEFLEKQAAFGLVLDGEITGADSFFVYAPRRIGWITAFRPDGSLKFHRNTIDPIPIPRLIQRGSVRMVDRSAPRSMYEIAIDQQYIYLDKGSNKDQNEKKYLIDVYDASTGDYQFSLALSEWFGLMNVRDHLIYASQDTAVIIWRWKFQNKTQE